MVRSTSSPNPWPQVSLSDLKRSTSAMTHDERLARPAGGGKALRQVDVEIRPVPEPGEAIDHRFLGQQVDQAPGAQRGTHAGTQLGGVERFGDVIGRAQVEPANLVLQRREAVRKMIGHVHRGQSRL